MKTKNTTTHQTAFKDFENCFKSLTLKERIAKRTAIKEQTAIKKAKDFFKDTIKNNKFF